MAFVCLSNDSNGICFLNVVIGSPLVGMHQKDPLTAKAVIDFNCSLTKIHEDLAATVGTEVGTDPSFSRKRFAVSLHIPESSKGSGLIWNDLMVEEFKPAETVDFSVILGFDVLQFFPAINVFPKDRKFEMYFEPPPPMSPATNDSLKSTTDEERLISNA